jgi:hypothetical protein
MGPIVVFRIPKDSDPTQTPRQYREYRILPSNLPAIYVQELRNRPITNLNSALYVDTLEDTSIDVFSIYEEYISKEHLFTASEFAHRSQSSLVSSIGHSLGIIKEKHELDLTLDQARHDHKNLLGCYALGVTLHDRRFQDAVVSKLIWMLRMPGSHQSRSFVRLLTRNAVQAIIVRYGTTSPIFLLVVSAYARFASAHEISTLAFSHYSGEFKSHVMKELGLLRVTQHIDGVAAADFVRSECKFHAHGFYEPCSLRKA